jgi:hypothetical protein
MEGNDSDGDNKNDFFDPEEEVGFGEAGKVFLQLIIFLGKLTSRRNQNRRRRRRVNFQN